MTRSWFLGVARAEGLSLLALLLVAMPLKYVAGQPEPVAWVGWVHGTLFLQYLIALTSAGRVEGWSWTWLGLGFVASLVPGGTFLLERRLPPPQG
jgi:integral membrane protein